MTPIISDDEEQLRQLFDRLQIADANQRRATISDLLEQLDGRPELSERTRQLNSMLSSIPSDADTAIITGVVGDALDICMQRLTIDDDARNESPMRAHYEQYLLAILQHSSGEIRRHGNRAFERILIDGGHQHVSPAVVLGLIDFLHNEQIADVQSTTQVVLRELLRTDDRLADERIATRLDEVHRTGTSTVRCRLYDLVCSLAGESFALFAGVKAILDKMLQELDNDDDPLQQINILAFVGRFASTDHGIVYVRTSGVFERIAETARNVSNAGDSVAAQLVWPAYMDLFAELARTQPVGVVQSIPVVLAVVFGCVREMDACVAWTPIAMQTVGHLLRFDESLVVLREKYDAELRMTMERAEHGLTRVPSTAIQLAIVELLGSVFLPKEQRQGQRLEFVDQIQRECFEWFAAGDDLHTLLTHCRKPFADMKLAIFRLLDTLCAYDWGRRAIVGTAGFLEYLLDGKADDEWDVKCEKQRLVDRMHQIGDTTAFGATIAERLRGRIAQPEVASAAE